MQKLNRILIFSIILILATKYSFADTIPDIGAESYIVIDAASGRIIGSKNADKKLPMASTTKIMTSILTIDNIKNLNEIIEIPEECTNIEGSSLYLKPNQKVSIIDLLYGTMLRSGNDAALALAYLTGNNYEKDFVVMMNDKAKSLGAYNTNFTNSNGLHDDNHYTTAYDLALISQYAMRNSIFKEIASCKRYEAVSLKTVLFNKNKVVHQYEYGSGIKIGYTKAAGRCLVASAEKDNTEIIIVVLNDNSWFQDSYKVFDWAFENYKSINIFDAHQYVCNAKSGEPVFTQDGFSYLLTDDEKNHLKFVPHVIMPQIVTGQIHTIYGYYNVYLENDLIHTGNLVSD